MLEGGRNLWLLEEHWFTFGDSCVVVSEHVFSDSGAGDVFVFLPGLFSCPEMWIPLGKKLDRASRHLFLEFPGFGRSFSSSQEGWTLFQHAELAVRVMSQLVPEEARIILFGHEMGGAIAQLCAIRLAERARALVLVNSLCLGVELGRRASRAGRLLHATRARRSLRRASLEPSFKHALLERWRVRSGGNAFTSPDSMLERTWPRHYERQYWRLRLRELRCPSLLLRGKKDSLTPAHHSFELMRLIPEAYYFENESCGHWACLEDLEWAGDKLEEFLFRVKPLTWREARHVG